MHILIYALYRIVRIIVQLESDAIAFVRKRFMRWIRQHHSSPSLCFEVLTIIGRARFDRGDMARDCDFMCFHDGFAFASDIIDNDQWMLYTFSESHAYFIHLPYPARYCNVSATVFGYLQQFVDADLVARIAVDELITNEQLLAPGHFRGRIVLLMSSPRCGSSMLAQMLQSTDECIVYSELDALSMIACFLDETRWSLRRIRAVLSITIRLLITTDNPIHTNIVLRCRANTIRLVPHIRRVQPSVRLLFMHRRQLDAQLLSMMQFSEQQCDNAFNRVCINYLNTKMCDMLQLLMIRSIHPMLADFFTMWHRFETRMYRLIEPKSQLEIAIVLVTRAWIDYCKYSHLFHAPAINYDDLVNDTANVMRPILELCGLSDFALQNVIECKRTRINIADNTGTGRSDQKYDDDVKGGGQFQSDEQTTIIRLTSLIEFGNICHDSSNDDYRSSNHRSMTSSFG